MSKIINQRQRPVNYEVSFCFSSRHLAFEDDTRLLPEKAKKKKAINLVPKRRSNASNRQEISLTGGGVWAGNLDQSKGKPPLPQFSFRSCSLQVAHGTCKVVWGEQVSRDLQSWGSGQALTRPPSDRDVLLS